MNSDKILGASECRPSSETLWRKLVDDETADSPAGNANGAAGSSDDLPTPAARPTATVVYRSFVRPPTALLTALDDGSLDAGETWRLRKSRTAIGRVTGDVVIPHDPDISAAHAEVVRSEKDGGHQWHLIDLGSTNGTFVRVQQIVLRNGKELLLGSRRLTFRCPDMVAPSAAGADASPEPRATRPQALAAPTVFRQLGARLTAQTAPGLVAEYALSAEGTSLGRDHRQCDVAFDDPTIDGLHASISQDARGRWILKDAGSLNGVWLRVSQIPLDNDAQFLLGGQRFHFRVL